MRVGEALLSRQAIPGDRFNIILRNTIALGVHQPEAELRRGIAGLS